jgi:hypothetical protein
MTCINLLGAKQECVIENIAYAEQFLIAAQRIIQKKCYLFFLFA